MLTVLRLSHRRDRDKRVTTHVGLVARAFGAQKIILSGEKDESVMNSWTNVSDSWGGDFTVEYQKNWKKVITDFKGTKVHLTMYGERIQDKISEIRTNEDVLVIVGSEKVPPEVYENSDYNLSVTTQPHSEIAALAIFLHEYSEGKELELDFKDPKLKVVPQNKGKKVLDSRQK